ncbi:MULTISPECIES: hypothetical protein [Desulfosediminicola]|uniref:hypothetical protein n=1 Tax=Desulfosediminicola TaxID=2886823 RepID=UPI0010ACC448|nr:hypothetical protein [Desulfosediminicola ganghwensis]
MQTTLIQPKELIVSIDDWQDYLRDGQQFLSTAVGAFSKKRKAFTSEALYNITAMAIEKLIMGFLMKNGDLAENHTMTDLAAALERHTGPLPDLHKKLLFLDSFQDICDPDEYQYVVPDEHQVSVILDIGLEVQQLILPLVQQNRTKPS